MNTLFDTFSSLDISFFSNLVLIGDFNIDVLSHSHYLCHQLYCILNCFSLCQVNTAPRHCSQNGHQSLIDHALLSSPEHPISCKTVPPLGNSDHLGLHITINGGVRKYRSMNPSRRQVWRYTHANFDLASIMLSNCDLNAILEPNDINLSWDRWKEIFLDVMERCIPTAFLPNRRNLPWLSKSLIQLMRKRNHLFQKTQASYDSKVWNRYRNLRNKVVTN